MTDEKPPLVVDGTVTGNRSSELTQRVNSIFLEPESAHTQSVSAEAFFNHLLMLQEPQPWLVVGVENTHAIPTNKAEIDTELTYKPNPRDLIANNVAYWAGITVKHMRVLQSFNRVHLIFVLPYGHLSQFEQRLQNQDPVLTAMKDGFMLLTHELADLRSELTAQIEQVKVEHKKAADAQKRVLADQARQLATHQAHLQAEVTRQTRRVSAASWALDPIVLSLSVEPMLVPFQFKTHYSALFWHLVAWGKYQTTQEQQVWKTKADIYVAALIHVMRGMGNLLTTAEIDQFVHWLQFSVMNPGSWMMGFSPDSIDALQIRGGG